LKAYRYLAGVPYEDLTLDEKYNAYCLAGAKLCQKLGRLEHKPERPKDMPEDEFKLAFLGTSRSNLGGGFKHLADAVDGWMDDSDQGNIALLGHRRWCLHPYMKKTGFDYVSWPPRGPMPVEFFESHHAWHVSLNVSKFDVPGKDLAPAIYKADAAGQKLGEALKLDYVGVDTTPFGIPLCIIFRPEKFRLTAGERYLVELDGLKPKKSTGPKTIRYLVEFEKWK
jgi:hypothetical protein